MNPRVELRVVPATAFRCVVLISRVCAKVRSDDPSILPPPGEPLTIHTSSEKEYMKLADALLKNNSITYLELDTEEHTESSAEEIAEYVRTSKRLRHILWHRYARTREERAEILCCFLPAIQECTSLKELYMKLPPIGELSNLAFDYMPTYTQT
jgi:hypothetical protein